MSSKRPLVFRINVYRGTEKEFLFDRPWRRPIYWVITHDGLRSWKAAACPVLFFGQLRSNSLGLKIPSKHCWDFSRSFKGKVLEFQNCTSLTSTIPRQKI
jgi:hypothetical protein